MAVVESEMALVAAPVAPVLPCNAVVPPVVPTLPCDAETFDLEHAAAQALVASLERQLVEARVCVKVFNKEKRKRSEAKQGARFLQQAVAGIEGQEPASPRESQEQPKAPRKAYQKKVKAAPDGECPICWNEAMKGWAGAAHPKAEFPACRLNRDISKADHKVYLASSVEEKEEE